MNGPVTMSKDDMNWWYFVISMHSYRNNKFLPLIQRVRSLHSTAMHETWKVVPPGGGGGAAAQEGH